MTGIIKKTAQGVIIMEEKKERKRQTHEDLIRALQEEREGGGSFAEGTGGLYAGERVHSGIPVAGRKIRTTSVAAPTAGGKEERSPSTVEKYRRQVSHKKEAREFSLGDQVPITWRPCEKLTS